MNGVLIPLKRLVSLNPETLGEETDPDRFFRYIDIGTTGRGTLVDEPKSMTFDSSPSRARRVLRPGDTILSTVRTYLRAVWTMPPEDDNLVASTGFVCLRPSSDLDARFLGWLAQSDLVVEEVVARSVGVSYPAVNPSDVGLIKVPCPSLSTQRYIADYLDRETARIDALVAAKRRMMELLLEKEQRVLLELVGDWRSELTWTLRQSGTVVLTGPFGTQLAADEYVQGGIPIINPTHISKVGKVIPDRNVSVSEHVALRLSRHRLRHGDVVMGRKGDVGRSAVITVDQDGWICGSDSIAIRTDPQRLNPQFLATVLHVSLYRQQLDAHSTGAMMANVNESTLLSFRVPWRSLDCQQEILKSIVQRTIIWPRLSSQLSISIDLIQERRRALITAAVAGQLDISEVL